ncbi:MAG TPA: DUF6113 family protein [Sporichthyaceae bacterium]|jgi:hypothetical protein|nr:DUF6113 family protein [Sporichthyaceae bacterium]
MTMPDWFTKRSAADAVGLATGLFLLGLLVGGLGAFAYEIRVLGVPAGVAVALLAQGAVLTAAGVWNAARSAAVLPMLGWVVSVVVFSAERPAGSVVIAPTHAGYAYLLGGVILFTGLCLLPYERIAGDSYR